MFGDDDDSYDDEIIFNEYIIDDTLDSLSRLEKYHNSDFSLQRLVLVREVYDTAVESGYKESVKRLLPLLSNFVSDSEPAVRQVFAEQLYKLAKFFVENAQDDKGYDHLLNVFMPSTFDLITDKNAEVGQAAIEALINISQLIKKEHITSKLLAVVNNLSHDERVEEYRMIAAKLYNELAPVFGETICREKVIPEIVTLSEDSCFGVRKTVAQNLGLICKTVGTDCVVNKLLPVFVTLSKDEIWGVRKACAESIAQIAKYVTSKVRSSQLVQIFEKFAEDVSRWVKIEAYKQLGPFIATFNEPKELSTELIQIFTGMAFQQGQSDNEMIEYCAYNFPAVCLTAGKERWNLLEKAYNALVKDVQWKVRRTLAYSLHEIAKIVGTEITEKTLISAFELFLRDLDEVKIGVVSHLGCFIEVLSTEYREKYLPVICNLPDETENWRIRNELAKQLVHLAFLYSPKQVQTSLVKLASALYNDSYAEVRKTALHSAGVILKRLCELEDETGKKAFISYLLDLASGTSHKRQMFVYACGGLMQEIDTQLFDKEFLPKLIELSKDKIPNVRMSLSILLNTALQDDKWKNHSKLLSIKQLLISDKDTDVKYFMTAKLEPPKRASIQITQKMNTIKKSDDVNKEETKKDDKEKTTEKTEQEKDEPKDKQIESKKETTNLPKEEKNEIQEEKKEEESKKESIDEKDDTSKTEKDGEKEDQESETQKKEDSDEKDDVSKTEQEEEKKDIQPIEEISKEDTKTEIKDNSTGTTKPEEIAQKPEQQLEQPETMVEQKETHLEKQTDTNQEVVENQIMEETNV